jgi:cell division protease FtsH
LVEEAYQRAVKLVTANKEKIDKLGKALLEKEVIFKEDLEVIFGQRPFEEERKRVEQEAEDEMKLIIANGKNKKKNSQKILPEGTVDSGEDEKKETVTEEEPKEN